MFLALELGLVAAVAEAALFLERGPGVLGGPELQEAGLRVGSGVHEVADGLGVGFAEGLETALKDVLTVWVGFGAADFG